MADFQFRDSDGFRARFSELPQDARGREEWQRGMRLFPFESTDQGEEWLGRIRALRNDIKPLDCPRVFVSHKKEDSVIARQLRDVIRSEGFDTWLDVIDLPPIPPLRTSGQTKLNQAILLAAIIEMALVNCSHLVAVMTDNTVSSRWVPYEYGRVKDDPPARLAVAAWVDPPALVTQLPEYNYLAPVFTQEAQFRRWLKIEKAHYRANGTCQL